MIRWQTSIVKEIAMPKVSVIITNYNHQQYLTKRIESVLAQTYTDYSIAIYDDCSIDNSRQVIEQYRDNPKVEQIIYNNENSGNIYRQWERAITNATGEWIWIAQSDDYAEPEFLSTLMGLTQQHEDVGIAFCGSHWINDAGKEGPDLSIYQSDFFRSGVDEIKLTLARQCSVQNSSAAIIRRDFALKAIKNISSHYKICGDWIFYLRILHNSSIAFTSNKLNYFRWYHDNISNAAINNQKWIAEGVTVLNNINYRKVNFSARQFYLVVRWWAGIIFRSTISGKNRLYKVLINALKYYGLKINGMARSK
jgi:glycosyltransferase involved in cell wall biosynthesis